jgi:hypothetical protein
LLLCTWLVLLLLLLLHMLLRRRGVLRTHLLLAELPRVRSGVAGLLGLLLLLLVLVRVLQGAESCALA